MVSQRQKLARKRFKEANPDLFPKPEPTAPKDPNKKKKRNSKFKRKKSDGKERKFSDKPNRGKFRKHPLRVPGMKPGESCFICKAQDHIAKYCPEKAQWEKNKFKFHVCGGLKNGIHKNEEESPVKKKTAREDLRSPSQTYVRVR
ncbi:hypothetical protein U1Q18_031624 [Sarracenia purpurea var. burkii]